MLNDQPTPTKPKTHALAVIDKSGSMRPLAPDVIGGYNTFLETLRNDTEVDYTVTTVTFSNTIDVLCSEAPAAAAPELSNRNYPIGGGTALNDAVMTAILGFEQRHPRLDDHEGVILFVHTDGHENTSREHSTAEVRAKITQLQATGKWAVMFMGTGPEAWNAGEIYGTGTVVLRADGHDTRSGYVALAASSGVYSRTRDAAGSFAVAEAAVAAADRTPNQ